MKEASRGSGLDPVREKRAADILENALLHAIQVLNDGVQAARKERSASARKFLEERRRREIAEQIQARRESP